MWVLIDWKTLPLIGTCLARVRPRTRTIISLLRVDHLTAVLYGVVRLACSHLPQTYSGWRSVHKTEASSKWCLVHSSPETTLTANWCASPTHTCVHDCLGELLAVCVSDTRQRGWRAREIHSALSAVEAPASCTRRSTTDCQSPATG
jgi:hypothetical protein